MNLWMLGMLMGTGENSLVPGEQRREGGSKPNVLMNAQ